MLKVKYKEQEYDVLFEKGLIDDKNQEIYSNLNFDVKEISINLNTPICELKNVFRVLAFKIVLLENGLLNNIKSTDIDKIAEILAENNCEVRKLNCAFDGIFGGFFASNFT